MSHKLAAWIAVAVVVLGVFGCRCDRDSGSSESDLAASTSGSASASAEPPSPAPSAQAHPLHPADARPFLWKVATNTATVYLLGSIHVARKDFYPLHPKIEAAYAESTSLVVEVPMDSATQLQAATKLGAAGTYPPGDSLRKHLDLPTTKLLDQQLLAAGLQPGAFDPTRPWLVSTVATLGKLAELGYDPKNGIDIHFWERAVRDGKQRLSLETVDEQVGLFTSLPEAAQGALLRQTLEELPLLGPRMQAAVDAWLRGDADALSRELIDPMKRPESKDVYERLLLRRNRSMAKKIDWYLATSDKYFVVVGSAHLVGDESIVALLRKGGRTVEQM